MRIFFKQLVLLLVIASAWFIQTSIALAQYQISYRAEEVAEKSYILGYVLTVLMIGLGVTAICRPGHRSAKPKMIEKELEHKLDRISHTAKDQ
jgi:hypothetical protein